MGASYWEYWVSYDDDVNAALQALRQAVFERGEYSRSGRGRVATIDELIERNAEDGTHSIIDMESVTKDWRPYEADVSPVSDDDLQRLFGTPSPTRPQVEASKSDVMGVVEARPGWTGSYIVTFEDGRPDQLFFFGISGD